MKTPSFLSLGGIAVMSACACGTSTNLSKIANAYGVNFGGTAIHHGFVLVGGTMIVAGLWQRARKAGLLAASAVGLLTIGEVLLPVMGIDANTRLSAAGLAGVAAYLLAGVLLVLAFRRGYQFENSTAGLVAMSGMAMSVGCNCCLVAQGVSGLTHALAPSQPWLASTMTIYAVATVAMALGLYKIGGTLPAAVVIGGHALNYYGLELPASAAPAIMAHGIRFAHISKYPLMLAGTTIMMGAFAWAYTTEKQKAASFRGIPTPEIAGD